MAYKLYLVSCLFLPYSLSLVGTDLNTIQSPLVGARQSNNGTFADQESPKISQESPRSPRLKCCYARDGKTPICATEIGRKCIVGCALAGWVGGLIIYSHYQSL